MKKEVFLAVFVGFALGLIITFGIWTANKSLSARPESPTPTPLAEITPTPLPQPSQVSLSLTSPDDESIASANSVQVTGKTAANSPVVVAWESGQTILVADSAGDFKTEVKLDGGYNRITITAYDSNGNSSTKDVLVTYTTSKI